MAGLQTNGSPQLELLRSFCLGIEQKDLSQTAKAMHKDHRRITYPKSLNIPTQTGEQYLERLEGFLKAMADGPKMTFHSVIETPGKVVVHITSNGISPLGVNMDREMILTAHIVTDEDGNLKIKQAEEFTDSKALLDVVKAIEEAKANVEHPAT
ncbi:hypothetical protein BJ322DRAFT_1063387 [Thelephora terrestris]|uniref:SnoaL-like domain-containing protein n=1 Tax=Thelephora terrestris TaxID=56493 RepID=A0A9P6L7D7_9AGAM|nr:hypothetical protein BJ322DRAFT_1063387 [Thelephora terrestris]